MHPSPSINQPRAHLPIVLSGLLLAWSLPVSAAFDGYYDPANWTTTITAGGSVDTSGAPASIALTSSNNNFGGNVDFTIAAAAGGTVSFDWDYETTDGDGPRFDPFGYLLNGSFTQLTDDSGGTTQFGSVSFAVLTGQIFGFRQNSTDGFAGSATTIGSKFTAPVPLPAAVWLFASGLLALLGVGGFTRGGRDTGAG